MENYSIKDLEKVSGIKAHTIRIWESRYGIFKPQRTETNIRFYDEDDLKLLLNISLLCGSGHRISRIAAMTRDQITNEVQKFTASPDENNQQINSLFMSAIQLDEEKFEKVFASCTLRLGFEKTMIQVIYPVLEKIGLSWQTGCLIPSQEHFISNLIRQKLIASIDAIETSPSPNAKKFLLFLPEGEFHEISLLFTSWIIRSRGHKVIYLGQSIPSKDLLSIGKFHQPDYFFTNITSKYGKGCPEEFMHSLSEHFPNAGLLFSGQVYTDCCRIPSNAQYLKKPAELFEILETL